MSTTAPEKPSARKGSHLRAVEKTQPADIAFDAVEKALATPPKGKAVARKPKATEPQRPYVSDVSEFRLMNIEALNNAVAARDQVIGEQTSETKRHEHAIAAETTRHANREAALSTRRAELEQVVAGARAALGETKPPATPEPQQIADESHQQ